MIASRPSRPERSRKGTHAVRGARSFPWDEALRGRLPPGLGRHGGRLRGARPPPQPARRAEDAALAERRGRPPPEARVPRAPGALPPEPGHPRRADLRGRAVVL